MERRDRRRYKAYLLRLWREPHEERWHVTIEEPQTGKRQAFTDVEEFITFLETFTVVEDGKR